MKYVAPLRDDEIQTLHDMHRYHPSRRARRRAHSLLLSHRGWSIPHIAQFYQVDRRSVSTWIDRWQTLGLVGLYDQPSSGRPLLLNDEEQHKVYDYLQQYPKDLKKVVQALEQETTKRVSTKTIKRLIKKTLYLEADQEISCQSA
jgi:transposase